MSSSATAPAVEAEADVIAFQPDTSRNSERFNMLGLPRISDDEHYRRALESGQPHSYIALRAGRMQYEGEDGLGFFNAARLHLQVMSRVNYDLDEGDITFARAQNPSFEAAVEMLKRYDAKLQYLFQCLMPDAFTIPRGPSFEI